MSDHREHDAHMARLQRVLDRLGEVTKQAKGSESHGRRTATRGERVDPASEGLRPDATEAEAGAETNASLGGGRLDRGER